MPHVEERLLVHGLVLERGIKRLGAVHRGAIVAKLGVLERLDHRRVGALAKIKDLVARWPFGIRAAARHGCVGAIGIDAALEQLFEPGVHRRTTQASPQEGDDAESRQVSFVENDWVPKSNRTRVVRGRVDQVEEGSRSRAVPLVPLDN